MLHPLEAKVMRFCEERVREGAKAVPFAEIGKALSLDRRARYAVLRSLQSMGYLAWDHRRARVRVLRSAARAEVT